MSQALRSKHTPTPTLSLMHTQPHTLGFTYTHTHTHTHILSYLHFLLLSHNIHHHTHTVRDALSCRLTGSHTHNLAHKHRHPLFSFCRRTDSNFLLMSLLE